MSEYLNCNRILFNLLRKFPSQSNVHLKRQEGMMQSCEEVTFCIFIFVPECELPKGLLQRELVLAFHLTALNMPQPYRCELGEKTCSYSTRSTVPLLLYFPTIEKCGLNDLNDATPK